MLKKVYPVLPVSVISIWPVLWKARLLVHKVFSSDRKWWGSRDLHLILQKGPGWLNPLASPCSRCPHDETVTYISAIGNSTMAKFSFLLFKFTNYSEVFLHCQVQLCHPDGPEPCIRVRLPCHQDWPNLPRKLLPLILLVGGRELCFHTTFRSINSAEWRAYHKSWLALKK